MGADHRRQQHERLPSGHESRRQRNDARQRPGHLDDRDRARSAERVLAVELDDEIQRLVHHLRKRVRRIQTDRRQQRAYLALEVLFDPGPLCRRAFGVAQHDDALARQRRNDLLVIDLVLPVHQPVRPLCDVRERLPQRRCLIDAAGLPHLAHQFGNADLEEFVQVRRHDAHVAQAFGQRHRGALRQRQHAFVERQVRQFAIQQARDRRKLRVDRALGPVSLGATARRKGVAFCPFHELPRIGGTYNPRPCLSSAAPLVHCRRRGLN